MSRNKIFLFVITIIMLCGTSAMAAQSTADVPVTQEMKDSARQKIVSQAKAGVNKAEEYVIGHGDVLSVQVYGEGDMSTETPAGSREAGATDGLRGGVGGVTVRIDGLISLKHIGDVDAVGLTLTQLADYLKVLFATVYDDPVVTVVLGQSNSKRYTVMGKVAQPGVYFIDYPINLVQVIARSGGFTEWANAEMTLVRNNPDEKDNGLFNGNTLKFDYDDFLAGKKLEKNVLVQAGDIIIVH
jgi:polysaccharide biosynthesis/export protein